MKISDFSGFIFDLDGVIYKGEQPIPGAAKAIKALKQHHKKYIFVTNHTKHTKNEFVTKLEAQGIELDANQLLTANDAVITYIRNKKPDTKKINLIGYGGIVSSFEQEGWELTDQNPDFVVVAWDPHFDYEKIYAACKNIRDGAEFIVTSPDRYIPSERGFELGFGTLGAAIGYATQKEPLYVGKPYPPMIETALQRIGLTASETIIVGDTPETDLHSKALTGLGGSILVLTGNITKDQIASIPIEMKPDFILNSVSNLVDELNS